MKKGLAVVVVALTVDWPRPLPVHSLTTIHLPVHSLTTIQTTSRFDWTLR